VYPAGASQVAIDATGNVWVGGGTASGLFPTVAPFEVQGTDQGFLAELSPDGSRLLFSSYAPGRFALGPQQTVYATGTTIPNPPKIDTHYGPQSITSVVTDKFDFSKPRTAVIDSIATPLQDDQALLLGIAPGELIRITGRGLGPVGTVTAQFDPSGRVATSLAGVQVLINGFPAPLISVSSTVIACMTPFEVSGSSSARVQVIVNGVGTPSVLTGVKQVEYAPGILAIANPNGTFNSASNPVHAGQSVTLLATGFGDTVPSVPDGSLYQSPLPVPVYKVTASAGVSVTYVGPAPGLVAGIWQINLAVAANAPAGALAVNLFSAYQIGNDSPQQSITIWVAP
jgi:uncharacterized protein (TIGR03437 family)